MEAINDVHVSEPGLVVVDVAAADDETAFAFHTALAARGRQRRWNAPQARPDNRASGCAATSTCASPSPHQVTPRAEGRSAPTPAAGRATQTAAPAVFRLLDGTHRQPPWPQHARRGFTGRATPCRHAKARPTAGAGPGLRERLQVLNDAQDGVHAGHGRGVDRAEELGAVETVEAQPRDVDGDAGPSRDRPGR